MMLTPLFAEFTAWHYLYTGWLSLLSIFLILVILVQRGRGGGLTGALGGMGGQSAFGTKAGDLFTRITIVVAAIWVLLSMASIKVLAQRTPFDSSQKGYAQPITAPSGKTGTTPPAAKPGTPATSTPATGTAPPSGTAPETK